MMYTGTKENVSYCKMGQMSSKKVCGALKNGAKCKGLTYIFVYIQWSMKSMSRSANNIRNTEMMS